jgi:hypothetical protein
MATYEKKLLLILYSITESANVTITCNYSTIYLRQEKKTKGLACISAIPGPISVIIIFSFENHVICCFLLKVAFTFTSEFDLISLSNPSVNSALASRTGRKKTAVQKLAVAVTVNGN